MGHTTATAFQLPAATDVNGVDLVAVDDQLNGFDVVVTSSTDAAGLSKTIADSADTDNAFTTTPNLGGKYVDTNKVKFTNLANGVKVGDKIRIEGQVRTVTYVSPLCQRGVVDSTDAGTKSKAICPSLTSSHYLMVEEDFVEDEFSTYTNIFGRALSLSAWSLTPRK